MKFQRCLFCYQIHVLKLPKKCKELLEMLEAHMKTEKRVK